MSRIIKAVAATVALAVLSAGATSVRSCGFEDPNSVGAARGLLNWAFPNAYYVTTAVWQAEMAGLLPPRALAKRNEFASYLQIVKALKSLTRRMSQTGGTLSEAPAVSIVLIDRMLWTRFEYGPQGYTAKVHADGPASGDVVIVTEGSVVQALLDARLSAEQVRESGLMRFYGDKDKIAPLQDLLHRIDFAATSPATQVTVEGH